MGGGMDGEDDEVRRLCIVVATLVLGSGSPAGWVETFDSDPLAGEWAVAGDASLYSWDGERLLATWDSMREDSYFWRPLGVTLDGSQGFELGFDLSLSGVSLSEGVFWEVSLGLVSTANMGNPSFNRGFVGGYPTNLVEWDFFPTAGVTPPEGYVGHVAVDAAGAWYYTSLPYETLALGAVYTVFLRYDGQARLLSLDMLENGVPFSAVGDIRVSSDAVFALDAFAVESYFAGGTADLFAQGWVDNVRFRLVPEPAGLLPLALGLAGLLGRCRA